MRSRRTVSWSCWIDRSPLRGRVLGRDGRPVESFKLLVGPGRFDRRTPSTSPSFERAVKDPAGMFAIGLDEGGRTWVGVRAEGYALWEAWVDVARSGRYAGRAAPPGVPVSGKILAPPGGLAGLQARLVPRRDLEDGRGLGSSRK